MFLTHGCLRASLSLSAHVASPMGQFMAGWRASGPWLANAMQRLQNIVPAIGSPPASGVSWPISSWVDYIAPRPALVDAIDFEGPRGMEGLHLIVRGDGYPIAGTTFCNLCIALANHGPEARRPAMNWPIGLATRTVMPLDTCGPKTLRFVFASNVLINLCIRTAYNISINGR